MESYPLPTPVFLGFPVAQLVKNPPAVRETWVRSLGWEDPLEKGTAPHSSIPAWRIPWTVAYHTSLSMGFSRQEYWSGVPLPSTWSSLNEAKA